MKGNEKEKKEETRKRKRTSEQKMKNSKVDMTKIRRKGTERKERREELKKNI